MIPTHNQTQYIDLIRRVISERSTLAWILPSYICATIEIESGWQPLVVNATGRQDGLMQVIPGTVAEVEKAYGFQMPGPQTDPYASLLAGILYFDRCARKITEARKTRTLYLYEVYEAYNLGWAGFLSGKRNDRYGLKALSAQTKWAFLDTVVQLLV